MDYGKLLNKPQLDGVYTTDGPVLILAGAGSGKTRVLTHRISYLIGEKGVSPRAIMAITFTNKAAGEMRSRVDSIVGPDAQAVWISTFHSACVRILRRFADHVGYDTNFSIYDADDSKAVMKEVLKKLNVDTKRYKERFFLNEISSAKNELIGPEDYAKRAGSDPISRMQVSVYREYESRLRANNAMDFDDLILYTVNLFRTDGEVLNNYHNRIKYVMVDEYQDTNTAQFELVRLLAAGSGNLCVVGDDDQSIYKFRGANIRNILDFEMHYPQAKVIRLEQNYRSTGNILTAANGVIANNSARKEKKLWTEQETGEKVRFRQFDSAYEEAQFIAGSIKSRVYKGDAVYRDCAVLYRTNAQSRLLEEKFLYENIPYRIVGGVNFYQRKEIKDILAYLKAVDNERDDLAIQRILNVPKRGIGKTTENNVAAYAAEHEISFYEALLADRRLGLFGRSTQKLSKFVDTIEEFKESAATVGVTELVRQILDKTGYREELQVEHTDESAARIENLDEFISKAADYERTAEEPTLSGFLEEVSLIADIDRLEESDEYVVLMTLHGAKGLEFPFVYMAGMEDGLFPGEMSIFSDNSEAEIEEERRLCYVGITRAMKELTMTAARSRMVRGEMKYAKVSRFVGEIPDEVLDSDTPTRVSLPKPKDDFGLTRGYSRPTGKKPSPTAAQTYKSTVEKAKSFGTKIEKQALSYGVGDRVKHKKFGEGEVTGIIEGGRDYEITVDFDAFGTKKMFASFAKLEKI